MIIKHQQVSLGTAGHRTKIFYFQNDLSVINVYLTVSTYFIVPKLCV